MAGDVGTGGVQSQLPAEPHQDGEGHGGAHGERDPRGPPHLLPLKWLAFAFSRYFS